MSTITKQTEAVSLKPKQIKIYAYDKVLKSSISYFQGDELAATTWMNKYAMKDSDGNFVELSPDDMHKRMAKEFGYIIPQGSVMSSLGNYYKLASLSNCIVVPEMHDSYGGVFYTDQQLAQLFKRRCGVGVDISKLRPSGARVSNAAGSTSGAVSFMNRFSNTTREVAQNGRRGALMLSMDIAHPDVADFITIKQDLQKVI